MARRRNRSVKVKEPAYAINQFADAHGMYKRESDGDKKQGRSTTIRNRHVTTVEAWKTKGLLSETQARGIEYCEDLWEKLGTSRPVVQDLLRVPGAPGGDGWAQQEAIDELIKLQDKIPFDYWQVFENVCRFDEPGGTAGSRWANDAGRATMAALTCVRMVADCVAMWRRL